MSAWQSWETMEVVSCFFVDDIAWIICEFCIDFETEDDVDISFKYYRGWKIIMVLLNNFDNNDISKTIWEFIDENNINYDIFFKKRWKSTINHLNIEYGEESDNDDGGDTMFWFQLL